MPKCEICHKEDANCIGQLDEWDNPLWIISGNCENDKRLKYHIEFYRLGETDWIEHLKGKTWFKLEPFTSCLMRLAYILSK